MSHSFQITFESNFLAIKRGLEQCVLLTIDCEAEVTGTYDEGFVDGVTILSVFDEQDNEIKLEDLAEGEQKQIQKLADDHAESKVLDWIADDDADRGDRAYDEWKDRQMEEGE